jgi:ubiquinone/menaquinone biosynthesis C-methylase UbiE
MTSAMYRRLSWFNLHEVKSLPDFYRYKYYLPEFDFENYQDPHTRERNIDLLKRKSSMWNEIITNKGGWLFPLKMYLGDMNYLSKATEQNELLDSFASNSVMARSIYKRFRYISDTLLPELIKEILNKKDRVKIASFGSGTGLDVLEAMKYFNDNITADFFDIDSTALKLGRLFAEKLSFKNTVRFFKQDFTQLKSNVKYDIGLMIGIICPLPDKIAFKVMNSVKDKISGGGVLLVSSSTTRMGESEPVNRFLAEYTSNWFLQFRTKERMYKCGESAGYKVLDVVNEPNDCNKLVICKNI